MILNYEPLHQNLLKRLLKMVHLMVYSGDLFYE
jgi:hypothetical protein